MIIFLMLVTVIKMLIRPQINTMAKACCQVKPKPNTTVNVKNALSPIPGACANGTLATKPIINVPIAAASIVATNTAPLSMPVKDKMLGFTKIM